MHLSIELPNDHQFSVLDRNLIAISPDGARVVYGANHRLYLRSLDQPVATPVAGTEAGTAADAPRAPFFSPDGTWIGFWQSGALKKVSVSGGEPVTITKMPSYVGASWGPDDRILLGGADGAYQVGANDGALTRMIAAKNNERTSSPVALPGGEWVLMVVHLNTAADRGQVVVQSRASGERQLLIDGARDVRYLSSGHLVFARDSALFAQAFDAARRTLSGEPVQVLQGVANGGSVPLTQVAVSSTGTLVYIPGSAAVTPPRSALVQVARDGTPSTFLEMTGMMWFPRYSPDGSRVAFGLNANPADGSDPSDLWVLDVARGARTRVTFAGNNRFYPIWTRDSVHLTFADTLTSTNSIRWALADGSGGLQTFADPTTGGLPTSWSPDGRALAYYVRTEAARRDIWILEIDGDKRTPRPFVATPYEERGAIFSPNGRWIAYVSNKSEQNDVYARPYPGPGAEVTISVGGGQEPVWGPSGRELFYRRGGKLLVVDVDERGASLVVGPPTVVFDDHYRPDSGGAAGGVANYDISPDGKRFVMVEEPKAPAPAEPRLNVILNWGDELKRRVPRR
jgi:serine/threonine-protein kinase